MGTIIKIAKTMVTIAEEISMHATNGNIEFHAAKELQLSSKDKIEFGEYSPPEEIKQRKIKKKKYEIKQAWWSDTSCNSINEAEVGDWVRFYIKTRNINDGTKLSMQLKDWDGVLNIDDKLKNAPKNITIKDNEGFVEFQLSKELENTIEEDVGHEIELYFELKFEGETYDLPYRSGDFLKVYLGSTKITVIIELPMKNFDYSNMPVGDRIAAKLGLLGHTAIAVENEFYDFGPEQDPNILYGTINESNYGDLKWRWRFK